MAAQAALEVHRRMKCEMEARMKAEALKIQKDLPGLEKSLEKTLLNRGLKRGFDLGRR